MKLKLEQLQISIAEKEEKIDDHNKKIADLANTVTKLQKAVQNLKTLVGDISCQVKVLEDKLNEEVETFKWIASIDKLKQDEQYCKRFYIISAPFSFQLSAAIKDGKLETWFYRCQSKNDTAGRVLSNVCSYYRGNVYLVNLSGKTLSSQLGRKRKESNLNIGQGFARSLPTGWHDFIEGSINQWVVNKHLHLFCKLEPIFD